MIDPKLRSLLLHRLPAAETARLEDAILLEDGFAERLCDAELDLLDEYAASQLSAADAHDVERYLLTSEQSRESLRVARALREVTNPPRIQGDPRDTGVPAITRRRRTSRVWGFATLLAACLSIVAYIPQWHLESNRPANGESFVPTIAVMADVRRGPARPSLSIPSSGTARLQVEVPDAAIKSRYSLTIQDGSRRRLFTASALAVHSAGRYRYVEAIVPAEVLGPGDRTISLAGSDNDTNADLPFTWQVTGVIR